MEGTDDMNMNISTDSEINVRLIDLSRIVSSMLETAETPSDIAFLRDEMLHTVAKAPRLLVSGSCDHQVRTSPR